MDTKKCKNCGELVIRKYWKGYPESKSNWDKRECCSYRCAGLLRRVITLTPEQEAKRISNLPRGEKHYNWKGDKVGLDALHAWLHKKLPKPKWCENCLVAYPYDLANKGIYNRDLKNWWWLCRKCHMKSDGRMKNLNVGVQPYFKRDRLGRFYVS